ncbi:MAG: response regulator [Gammaproteobacteria bacterium]
MLRVLVVDDDRDFADSLADLLLMKDLDVEVRYSAADALASYAERPFDLVFLDIKMPEVDGLGCLEAFRERGWQVPVVIMTGFALSAVEETAGATDAMAVVGKPLDLERIDACIEQARAAVG